MMGNGNRYMKLIIISIVLSCTCVLSLGQNPHKFVRSRNQERVMKSTDYIATGLPAVTLVTAICLQDWKGILEGVEVAAATTAVTLGLKYVVKEWRPDMSDTHSFPSGHTSMAMATAGFIQRRYGWAWGAPAFALATYVGWGRVFAHRHYVWDTVVGACIGAASAYIFTTPFARQHNLQIAPSASVNNVGAYLSFEF